MYEALLQRPKELIRYDNIPVFLARNMAEVANEYVFLHIIN
jgi:hypothetical protein